MIRRLLPLLALLGCVQPSGHTESAPPPPRRADVPSASAQGGRDVRPPFLATGTAQRVVLLSFDGLGAGALASQTTLPAFARMTSEGASTRVIPVNPTVTSSTHVSILTGAQPDVHGIIANRFHVPGTPPDSTARGLETEIDAETIVEAARRQGKRVGTVPFPTVDGRSPRRRGDFGFAYSSSVTSGRIIRLTRTDFHREWVPPTWTQRPARRTSYSPIMRARIEWSITQRMRNDVDVVAYDTTNDAAANYDLFIIETDEREIAPDARGWFALSAQRTEGLYGSWSKILRADASLGVALYWGPITRTDAWPASFQQMLDAEIGFWPGAPDERGEIDVTTFIEQTDRLAAFLRHAQTLAIRRMPFDLLLAYHPAIDSTGHNYLGVSEEAIRAAYANADRGVAAIAAALDLSRDAFLVTGDHGLSRIDTEVRMNRLLADRGFAPRWRAYASGSIAHLYRFEGADDADALVAMLKNIATVNVATGFSRSSEGPAEAGPYVFERVTKKEANAHRNSGDVIAYAHPNVTLTPSSDAPAVVKPENTAHHGALNTHRELHTLLLARGAGVPRTFPAEISQTRIARFVAQLLGMQPPASAE
ncbi:MAG TPA: alkaline phosphatase family protein [Thermoanaerobaculia bacterium]|nr:alkaline phosphatase family protein [Thermoanaerobaculia bacterium]